MWYKRYILNLNHKDSLKYNELNLAERIVARPKRSERISPRFSIITFFTSRVGGLLNPYGDQLTIKSIPLYKVSNESTTEDLVEMRICYSNHPLLF